jgi:DNA-binding NtrC family response regulator
MPLALQSLQTFNRKYGVSRMFGPEVLREMETYDWPGNVRELQNVVERMVVTAGTDVLAPEHLPKSVYQARSFVDGGVSGGLPWGTTLREARDMLEKQLVLQALRTSGNTREAAKLLGVTHPTIVRKAQKYGLRVDSGSENRDKLH